MSLFRRASSSLATLAFRAARSPVSLRRGAVSAERLILGSQQLSRGSVFSFSRFSTESAVAKTTADENLVSVLESEIKCAMNEEAADDNVMEDVPEGFPFEIIDTPGERTLFLTREFEDETIQVEVDSSASYDDDEEEEEEAQNDDEDDDEESSVRLRIPMVVSVSKGDDGVCLEFGVSAYPDEIVIDSLSIKQPQGSENELAYEGPDFDDLDENLQKAFHRFLEIRGIKPCFIGFLADYVANKDSREYLQWLKDVKAFLEK